MLLELKLKTAQAFTAGAWLLIELGERTPQGRLHRVGEWLERITEHAAIRAGIDPLDLYARAAGRGYWRVL